MIVDGILHLIYGFFEFVFDLLPIPDVPEWYLTEVYPVLVTYTGRATRIISFIFPASLWIFLVDFTKDMILVRVMYDIMVKFHILGTRQT